jgi:hypothetical protein
MDHAVRIGRAKCTRPTGFSSEPPPGPAIPVIETDSDARDCGDGALGHRPGDRLRHGAVGVDQVRATPSISFLAALRR